MLDILKGKRFIFFDVGFTLERCAAKDWALTNRFLALAGERMANYTPEDLKTARAAYGGYMERHYLTHTVEEEVDRYIHAYGCISDALELGLTQDELRDIALDRAYNMDNFIPYEDSKSVLEALSKDFGLGIISDTWPSVVLQLKNIGVYELFSTYTYSCDLGVCKPDRRMYLDALSKCGFEARDTAFVDDSIKNLDAAAELGITPILIAANPRSDVPTEYCKIYSLSELIK